MDEEQRQAFRQRLRHAGRLAPMPVSQIDATQGSPPETEKTCFICGEEGQEDNPLTEVSCCRLLWCGGCLKRYFELVLKTELHYPPKCGPGCTGIPPNAVVPHVTTEFMQQYVRKVAEYNTSPTDRLYCANPRCSYFLGHKQGPTGLLAPTAPCTVPVGPNTAMLPWGRSGMRQTSPQIGSQTNRILQPSTYCPKCQSSTCGICGELIQITWPHACKALDEHEALVGYQYTPQCRIKACPSCHQLFEHREACNHMSCLCGHSFCWVCLISWVLHPHPAQLHGCPEYGDPPYDGEGYDARGYHRDTGYDREGYNSLGLNRQGLNRLGTNAPIPYAPPDPEALAADLTRDDFADDAAVRWVRWLETGSATPGLWLTKSQPGVRSPEPRAPRPHGNRLGVHFMNVPGARLAAGFMDLPPEIRNGVYMEAVRQGDVPQRPHQNVPQLQRRNAVVANNIEAMFGRRDGAQGQQPRDLYADEDHDGYYNLAEPVNLPQPHPFRRNPQVAPGPRGHPGRLHNVLPGLGRAFQVIRRAAPPVIARDRLLSHAPVREPPVLHTPVGSRQGMRRTALQVPNTMPFHALLRAQEEERARMRRPITIPNGLPRIPQTATSELARRLNARQVEIPPVNYGGFPTAVVPNIGFLQQPLHPVDAQLTPPPYALLPPRAPAEYLGYGIADPAPLPAPRIQPSRLGVPLNSLRVPGVSITPTQTARQSSQPRLPQTGHLGTPPSSLARSLVGSTLTPPSMPSRRSSLQATLPTITHAGITPAAPRPQSAQLNRLSPFAQDFVPTRPRNEPVTPPRRYVPPGNAQRPVDIFPQADRWRPVPFMTAPGGRYMMRNGHVVWDSDSEDDEE